MMKFLFFVLALINFPVILTSAQTNTWEWAQAAGAEKHDFGNAITDDPSGNIYAGGAFYDSVTFGGTTLIANGHQDAFVVKYNPAGTVLWAKNIGGTWLDRIFGVSTDNFRNVFVTGISGSPELVFAGDTLDTCGFFIAKYDSVGNELWIRSSTGVSDEAIGNAIDVDYFGNSYATGKFTSPTITFNNVTLTKTGTENMFIVRYDAAGNFSWVRKSGGSTSDYGSGVSIDNSGSGCVTGSFWNDSITFGNITLYNGGAVNVFTVKYDVLGNVIWAKSANNVSGPNGVWGSAITGDAAGNMYVTGTLGGFGISFGNYTLNTSGLGDVFVTKYGLTGNVLWARKAGGNANEYGRGISLDSFGNTYVTGTFETQVLPFGNTTIYNSGNRNVFVMKFNPTGNPLWALSGEGNYDDWGHGICTNLYNETYITGEFRSAGITFDNIYLSNSTADSTADFFIAKLGTSVGVAGDMESSSTVKVFPNPFTSILSVEITQRSFHQADINLQDVTGRLVYAASFAGQENGMVKELDFNHIPAGIYFLNVTIDGEVKVKLVVKE